MVDIKLFIRNLMRNKLYFAITVLGFAIALTFVLVLSVYIRQELSVDRFHKNKDRIYRLVDETGSYWGSLVGSELQGKYPEIECFTRLYSRDIMIETPRKGKMFFKCLLADSSFFRMFSFPLVKGDPATVFLNKNSIVLTRSYARKIFGSEDIIGQEILVEEKFKRIVTGIMEDIPYNTHIRQVDGIVPFEFLGDLWMSSVLQNNDNSSFGLYLMTYSGADITSKKELILADFKKSYWKYHDGHQNELNFEPLTSVYWGGKQGAGTRGNSRTTIAVLSTIAFLVLILALINYNNLSIAQTANRAKEAAVKKLLGIDNFSLLKQFISESVVLCTFSFAVALLFSWTLQPFFEHFFNSRLYYADLWNWKGGTILIVSILMLGGIAGFIPSWMITRYKPVEVVKGVFRKKIKSVYGNILICFQYVVAIALMISTFTIALQVHYLRNYKLGFDQENVIWLSNRVQPSEKEALRNEFMRIPGVLNLSFCSGSPLDGGNNNSFEVDGKPVSCQIFKIDTAFFHVLDIRVEPTGVDRGIWVNRTLVREFELGDKPLNLESIDKTRSLTMIAGITDDFHFSDLRQKIGSAYLVPLEKNEYPWSILVKIDKKNPVQTYEEIKKVYKGFIGDQAFDSGFMDQTIDEWYKEEDRTVGLIGYFTVVACTLAFMGILGMAAYFIRQRLKEIGLRRINGAKVTDVLYMLILGFVKWVILAFVIAVPIAWYFMDSWLATYPYHTSQQVWIYVVVGIVVCVIAVLMVGGQSYQAASLNPVKTLRNE